jgi:hypothetical protein
MINQNQLRLLFFATPNYKGDKNFYHKEVIKSYEKEGVIFIDKEVELTDEVTRASVIVSGGYESELPANKR